jgi:hypothetical protein
MPDAPTFGKICAEALKTAKRANPNLGWDEVANIIQQTHDSMHDLTLTAEEPKVPRMSKKDVNGALFDAICEACELNAKEMTRPARGRVGKAVSEIRAASPDVTPEEIARRAKLYRRLHPTWGNPTPTALSAYWHEGSGDKTDRAKRDTYQEPQHWRAVLLERGMPGWSQGALEQIVTRQWNEVRALYGSQILARIQ